MSNEGYLSAMSCNPAPVDYEKMDREIKESYERWLLAEKTRVYYGGRKYNFTRDSMPALLAGM